MAPRKRIGDLLVEAGLLTQEQLSKALQEQRETKMRLGEFLINRSYITEQQLIEVLEFQLGIPHIQLFRQKIDPKVINLIPQRVAEQHQVLPVRVDGNKLLLAMADPLDYFAIDELRMSTGLRIEPTIAAREELQRAIRRYYGLQESVEQISQILQTREAEEITTQIEDENSPVVKTVNQIIIQAVQVGASDIHIDPQEDALRIRYRVDGVMRTERTLPPHMQRVLVARIKIMANLNVAERRLPQDGRVEIENEFRKVDIRISTLPTIHGEKVVMRVLDLGSALTDIEKLGFSESNYRQFMKGIQSAHGVVLITGPTGSGKTSTLYSALARLNSDDINVITIEDPVEYQLPGINQIQVNTTTGLTFARGLRAILRQDPNIVMIGEIRDMETAEIAVRTAMTGHLVLSTLHTNNAANTVTRLIDMGIEPFLIASSLKTIVAQRLVRRVCPSCSQENEPTVEEKRYLGEHGYSFGSLRRGAGCVECGRTGYKGRLAIHEVLTIDETLKSMILEKRADSDYQKYAESKSLIPLIRDGLNKVVSGQTTVSEVIRVLGSY
ncbi:type IV pilus assembly protein PilB [Paenibacillus sp. UNCCL117]|uniref:GspE/PulE family protein n=1 Tax=unclassified Paenibacillus TaxID=185978 RepID=UPI0008910A5B|nr:MULTISPECIES: ATPase, T2SS/T4P/T4SS family [unclassified Paenibacillus]SDC46643.1 type IV pilus assembly protein PilB [Paenibacillus sp. cl123]SFW12263.1 type IV pilus assembly protein PilB [Paenibacillus sp. UNCCL117]